MVISSGERETAVHFRILIKPKWKILLSLWVAMILVSASELSLPRSDSNYHQFNFEGIIEQNEIAYKDNHSTSTANIPNSIIIFVSFSMPPSSLKSWLNDAQVRIVHDPYLVQ